MMTHWTIYSEPLFLPSCVLMQSDELTPELLQWIRNFQVAKPFFAWLQQKSDVQKKYIFSKKFHFESCLNLDVAFQWEDNFAADDPWSFVYRNRYYCYAFGYAEPYLLIHSRIVW